MSDSTVDILIERLDRLERGLRWWRILGVIGWAALAASVAFGYVLVFRPAGAPDGQDDAESDTQEFVEDEVKARAFVLVDEEGRPRAALGMRPDGTPALAFSTEDGHIVWKAP
jgi:hypothetical protein